MSITTSERFSPRKLAAALFAQGASQLRDGWSAIFCSLYPGESEAWLAKAQLDLYRQSTRYSALILPVAAFLIAQACEPWISADIRYTWCGVILVLCVAFHFIGERLDATADDSAASVGLRARSYSAINILFMAAWCSMSVFLWAPGVIVNHMLLILVLACSLAGAMAITAVHPALALTVFVSHAVFILVPTASGGARLDHVLGWLSSIFVVLIAGQLVAVNKAMTKMLTLEHDRADLVDDLQRAKQDSDRERTRAEHSGRAKSEFLSHMNHELRTPMNAILGFSELIRSKAFGGDIEKYTEYAGIIHDSGQLLLGLIDSMIDLAKIEGGRLYLRESEFNLALLIEEEYETNAPPAEARKLSFVKTLSRGLPWVRADERGMRQIVANLLSNALKYTPAGGCVTLFARMEPDGRIAFGVEDTGIGIAPEDHVAAFERFGKGRHDVTVEDRGVGLGLAIVKGFAEAHDGEVTLESEPGSGTRVTVYLPRDRVIAAVSLRAAS